jgi:asparagine synthase (glutamine-hydrolysing)
MIGGIAGYFQRTNNQIDDLIIDRLDKSIHVLGPENSTYSTTQVFPQLSFARMVLPLYGAEFHSNLIPTIQGNTIVASAILANKKTLVTQLNLPDEIEDSELILHAYHQWGTGCLNYLEGKFSFVIWDASKKQLFCANGPTGLTDLYYYIDNDKFIFGTQIKSVLAQLDQKPSLNPLFFIEHLEEVLIEPNGTTYHSIYRLEPAKALLISANEVKEWCYWIPGQKPPIYLENDQAYVNQAHQLITEILEGYVSTGLKIGLQTGGGMNCAMIAAVLSGLKSEPLVGVSYCLPENYSGELKDEKEYTDLLASHLAMNLFYVNEPTFPDPYDQDIEVKMQQQDSQIVNPNGSDHYVVYGKMKELGVQLCITTGFKSVDWSGEDVLIDYISRGEWKKAWSFNRTYLKKSIPRNLILPLIPNLAKFVKKIKNKKKHPTFISHQKWIQKFDLIDKKTVKNPIFSGKYEKFGFYNDQLSAIKRRLFSSRKYISAQEYRYNFVLINPFQDRRLIDFALSIPREQHILDGKGRNLLRRLLVGKVPEKIFKSPSKRSYPADLKDRWLNTKPHLFTHFELIADDAKVWEYVDRSTANELYKLLKNSAKYSVWLQNRDKLNKVVLLDRFLRFNENHLSKL